jgi:hypothetical protein
MDPMNPNCEPLSVPGELDGLPAWPLRDQGLGAAGPRAQAVVVGLLGYPAGS